MRVLNDLVCSQLNGAASSAEDTLTAAAEASETAAAVLEKAQNATLNMETTLKTIADFLAQDKATPEEVETVRKHVFDSDSKIIVCNPSL